MRWAYHSQRQPTAVHSHESIPWQMTGTPSAVSEIAVNLASTVCQHSSARSRYITGRWLRRDLTSALRSSTLRSSALLSSSGEHRTPVRTESRIDWHVSHGKEHQIGDTSIWRHGVTQKQKEDRGEMVRCLHSRAQVNAPNSKYIDYLD
jgi:hypothetical protein